MKTPSTQSDTRMARAYCGVLSGLQSAADSPQPSTYPGSCVEQWGAYTALTHAAGCRAGPRHRRLAGPAASRPPGHRHSHRRRPWYRSAHDKRCGGAPWLSFVRCRPWRDSWRGPQPIRDDGPPWMIFSSLRRSMSMGFLDSLDRDAARAAGGAKSGTLEKASRPGF
jgi:hypothetical protein